MAGRAWVGRCREQFRRAAGAVMLARDFVFILQELQGLKVHEFCRMTLAVVRSADGKDYYNIQENSTD